MSFKLKKSWYFHITNFWINKLSTSIFFQRNNIARFSFQVVIYFAEILFCVCLLNQIPILTENCDLLCLCIIHCISIFYWEHRSPLKGMCGASHIFVSIASSIINSRRLNKYSNSFEQNPLIPRFFLVSTTSTNR